MTFSLFPCQHDRLNTTLKFHFELLSLHKIRSLDFLINLHTAYFMLHVPLDSIIESVIAVGGVLLMFSNFLVSVSREALCLAFMS